MKTTPLTKARIVAIACMLSVGVTLTSKAADTPQQHPSDAIRPVMKELLDGISRPLDKKGYTHADAFFDLEEHIADEMGDAPEIKQPMYQAAIRVCEALTDALRQRAIAKGDLDVSKTIHGDSDLGVTKGWTESKASRWRMERERQQLAREKQEQKRADKKAKQVDAFFNSAQKLEWMTTAAQLRAGVERLYRQEREVERQCDAAETAESQKRAVALYPDLAKADSPLNQDFLRRYNALKASGDPTLQDLDWPEKLAKQRSDAISPSSQSPTPGDKKDVDSQQAQNATSQPGLAEKLAHTSWSVPFQKVDQNRRWVTLNQDMTVRPAWNEKNYWSWWKVLDNSMIMMQTAKDDAYPPKILTFNKDFTEATDQFKNKYSRIEKPADP